MQQWKRRRAAALLLLCAGLVSGCADLATEPDRTPTSLELTPQLVRLTEGESTRFTVRVLDQRGEPFDALPAWAPPEWSPSDPSRLTLEADGSARAVGPGQALALVRLAGLETSAMVRTNPLEVGVGAAAIYLTQATQRVDGGVPIVAQRDALLRVFVTADRPNFFEPEVRATAYLDGAVALTEMLGAGVASIPEEVDESSLSYSYDLRIPGSMVRDGLGLVVEIDPAGALPSTSSSALRIPATGELAVNPVEVPPLELTIVPITLEASGLSAGVTEGTLSSFTRFTRDVFPLDQVDVELREPYTTDVALETGQGWSELLQQIDMLRTADGSSRYYYGAIRLPPNSAYGGLGYVGYPVAIGTDASEGTTLAHELGHNFDLLHAPCGGPSGVDAAYPHNFAYLGAYGYELSTSRLKSPEENRDLMSYCTPRWISDYHYEKVMAFRDQWDWPAPAAAAATEESVVVWGGVRDGRLELEPALTVETRPRLPAGRGRYRVEGLDASGAVLFSLSFDLQRLDHDETAGHFAFAVPSRVARPDRLETLRIVGPEGRAERGRAAGRLVDAPEATVRAAAGRRGRASLQATWRRDRYPLAVVRDRGTGRILAISRTGRAEVAAGAAADVEILLSDGVRTRPARLRRP